MSLWRRVCGRAAGTIWRSRAGGGDAVLAADGVHRSNGAGGKRIYINGELRGSINGAAIAGVWMRMRMQQDR